MLRTLTDEENKLKGLINGILAQNLYFLQNIKKRDEEIEKESERFRKGLPAMRKKYKLSQRRRDRTEKTLEASKIRYKLLNEDNSAVCLRIAELRDLIATYKHDIVTQERELKYEVGAMQDLDCEITAQIDKVNNDILEIDQAVEEWAVHSKQRIDSCGDQNEKLFSSFDDWSQLWPCLTSILEAESAAVMSTKTVATLQGIIGEWRGLRAIALAMKQLNTAMDETLRFNEITGTAPFDYNVPFYKLKINLLNKNRATDYKIKAVGEEILSLEALRKRLKTMMMNLNTALESDLCEKIIESEKIACRPLNTWSVDGQVNGDDDPPIIPKNRVRQWMQKTSTGGKKKDKKMKLSEGTMGAVHIDELRELLSLESFYKASYKKHPNKAMDKEETEQKKASNPSYWNMLKHRVNGDFFDEVAMTSVISSMECRKTLNALQWSILRYKAALSQNWVKPPKNAVFGIGAAPEINQSELVERCEGCREDVIAQMQEFDEFLSYQITGKHLACALNAPFPCPADWLTKQVILGARILNTREFMPTTANLKRGTMSKASARKAIHENTGLSTANFKGHTLSTITENEYGVECVSFMGNKVRLSTVNAVSNTLNKGKQKGSGNEDMGVMLPVSEPIKPSSVVQDGKGGKKGGDDSDDSEEEGVADYFNTAEGAVMRLATYGFADNDVDNSRDAFAEAIAVAREMERGDVDKVSDRLIYQQTTRLPGVCKDALNVNMIWQQDRERLKVCVENIHSGEKFYLLVAQQDVNEIFEGEQFIRSSNMTNMFLCQSLMKRMKIEKVPRSNAYGLLVSAKACGMRRKSLISSPMSPILNIAGDEDKVKMLTVRGKNGVILLCGISRQL